MLQFLPPSLWRRKKTLKNLPDSEILIVGTGFAGASTAFHLSRMSSTSILMVDQEQEVGLHASGRNAGLVRQCSETARVRQLTVESRKAYQPLASRIGFHQHGSLQLGARSQLQRLVHSTIESDFREPRQVRKLTSVLRDYPFETALWTPSDGVMEIAKLLRFYLQESQKQGVQLLLGCQIEAIRPRDRGFDVTTSRGLLSTAKLINAAGAWAPQLGRMAGAAPSKICPLRRHLFRLAGLGHPPSDNPFVWSHTDDFYFRPAAGGLLFCVCDEEPSSSLLDIVDQEISERLAELIWQKLPALQDAVKTEVWSCFRSRTPDDLPVIGWDPRQKNLFWVAGLGGFGMSASWAIGHRAAQLFLNRRHSNHTFDPARFDRPTET